MFYCNHTLMNISVYIVKKYNWKNENQYVENNDLFV